MCGILGYICTDPTQQYKSRKFFEDGLYMDALRGMHSTGAVAVWPDEDTFVVRDWKKAVPAYEFLASTSKSMWSGPVRIGMIGHNRHATMGAVTDDNAHPFTISTTDDAGNVQHDLIGVHNGSVNRVAVSANHPVDSYNLYYSIASLGIKALDAISGPYALVWYDLRDATFYFARNHGRPLHCFFTPDGKGMYYASEAEMLHCIARRNKISIKDDQVFSFDTGKVYSVYPELNEKIEVKHTSIPRYVGATVHSTPAKEAEAEARKAKYSVRPADRERKVHSPYSVYPTKQAVESDELSILEEEYDVSIGKPEMFYVIDWAPDPWGKTGVGTLKLMTEVWKAGATNRDDAVTINATMNRCHEVAYEHWKNAANLPFKIVDLYWDSKHEELNATVQALSKDEMQDYVRDKGDEFWYEGDWSIPTLQELQPKIAEYNKEMQEFVESSKAESSEDGELGEALADQDGEPDPVSLRGPGGRYITEARWKDLTKHGCGWCGGDLFTTEANSVEWEQDSPICKTCSDEHSELISMCAPAGTVH